MIHSHWTAVVVLAVVVFLLDSLRGKTVPLAKQSGIAFFKRSCGILCENCCIKLLSFQSLSTMRGSIYFTKYKQKMDIA